METFEVKGSEDFGHVLSQITARMHATSLDFWVAISKEEPRSVQSHNHQFAEIYELYNTLPESLKDAPYAKSKEAFRKHGLIEKGYCDVTTMVIDNREDAMRVGKALKEMGERDHGYAVVNLKGNVMICATPHSQSYAAMGKRRFQESKQAVLDWAHELLGVPACPE